MITAHTLQSDMSGEANNTHHYKDSCGDPIKPNELEYKRKTELRKGLTVFFLIIVAILGWQNVEAQLAVCDTTVPYFQIDLTGTPDSSWTSPSHARDGFCCGVTGSTRCTSFEVTLDSSTVAIEFSIIEGAIPPGSLFWQENCTGSNSVDSTICLSGVGPHFITFCKPGNNQNIYQIKAIPKPIFPDEITTRIGCVTPIEVLGLENSTITFNSVYPGTYGQYNNLLSATADTSVVDFTPTLATQPYIEYEICGFPIADECGFILSVCDTVRVNVLDELQLSVVPDPASFCENGAGVELIALASGGDGNYTYVWEDDTSALLSFDSNYLAARQTTYTIEIQDGLGSVGCPSEILSVPVVEGALPIVDAGPDETLLCFDTDEFLLEGSVLNASGGIWSGGGGSFFPSNTSLTTTYMPSLAELTSGGVDLYLTSTGAGGGCPDVVDTISVLFSDSILINLPTPPVLCFGEETILTPSVSGGNTPYSYQWSTGEVSSSITVGQGSYTLIVTDSLGCNEQENVVFNTSSELVTAMSSVDVSVDGGSDGLAIASPSGGTPPYSYLWDDPLSQTTDTATGLSYGVYTVTITDSLGCQVVSSVVVNEPRCLGLSSTITESDVLCFGDKTGSVAVTPSGGTAPYSYLWDTGHTDSTITNLEAGTYTVLVTDSNGCVDLANVSVFEPARLTEIIVSTDIPIIGDSTGTATVNVFGGTMPYTYLWSNGDTTQSITGLIAGVYSVQVTDSNACIVIDSVRINEPPCDGIAIGVNASNLLCAGDNSGTATAVAINAVSPVSYSWNDPLGQATPVATGLAAGTYTVTIIDSLNCTTFKSVSITEPTALTAGLAPTGSQCYQDNDGTIELTVTGGTFPYFFNWSNGQSVEDLQDLSPDFYTVTITDNNGCTFTDSVEVTEPAELILTYTNTDVTCTGGSDAMIDLTVTGGIPPYAYSWTTGDTVQDLDSLPAGLYDVTVTDANTCIKSTNGTLFIDEPISIGVDSIDVACPSPGADTTQVTVYPSGGNGGPYSVSFDNGSNFLAPGVLSTYLPIDSSYSVVITDISGCVIDTNVGFSINPAVVATSIDFDLCHYSDTSTIVTVTPGGGDGVYYQVSFDGGTTYQNIGVYTDTLPVGANYTIVVRDSSSCVSVDYPIAIPSLFLIDTVSVTSDFNGQDISCFGLADGEATVIASGGSGALTYNWSNGDNTAVADSLSAGTYYVTVTDVNGCSIMDSVTLVDPVLLTGSAAITSDFNGQDISCNGLADGEAAMSATGGTGALTYAWSNGDNTAVADSLSAGTYYVTVTDVNGCSIIDSVTLVDPVLLTGSAAITSDFNGQDISCNGLADGEAAMSATGGTGVLTYAWSNGDNTAVADSLSAGTYYVTVTDINGCSIIDSVTLVDPVLLTGSASITSDFNGQDISCNGLADGEATMSATGGTGTLTYAWTNGDNTPIADSLSAGTYYVSVTDINGCSIIDSVTLVDPVLLTGSASITSDFNGQDISCFGASDGEALMTASGGTGTLTYMWSNGDNTPTADSLGIGTHYITVTDTNGCSILDSVTITSPAAISVVAVVQDPSCSNSFDGEITASVGGGTAPFTYSLNGAPSQVSNVFDSLSAGVYTVTVVDVNACVGVGNAILTDQYTLSLVVQNQTNVSCSGQDDGTVTLQAIGGQAPFTYTLNSGLGQASNIFTGLATGLLDFEVVDINGCSATTSTNMISNIPLSLNFDSLDQVLCNGTNMGAIYSSASGGGESFNYSLNGSTPQANGIFTNLFAGTYIVEAVDTNGCSVIDSVTLNDPILLSGSASITSDFNGEDISCAGLADGEATMSATGGTGVLSYSWSNGDNTPIADSLSAGTYYVTVTDVNACSITDSVTLVDPVLLTGSASITSDFNGQDISCMGLADGEATMSATGGTGVLSYSWSNGDNSPIADSLGAGTYYVIVTDVNACSIMDSVTLFDPVLLIGATSITSDFNGQDISCTGLSDGEALMSAIGGTGTLTYAWTNGDNTPIADSLSTGTYYVTVTDTNGCSIMDSVTLVDPILLTGSATVTSDYNGQDIRCNGLSDGEATISAMGGTGTLNYAWTNGDETPIADSLSAGTYYVTVTDINGCSIIDSVTLVDPVLLTGSAAITSDFNGQDISCAGLADGEAVMNATGGTGALNYIWSNGDDTPIADSLSAGTYYVTVVDTNACIITDSVTLVDPVLLSGSAAITSDFNGQDISCAGLADGEAVMSASGGTGTLSYSWTNGDDTAIADSLSAGTYYVTVTDINGCSVVDSVTLVDPTLLTGNAAVTSDFNGQDISCNGLADGDAEMLANGGTGTLTYAWTNGDNTSIADSLSAGTYYVTVTDINGCSIIDSVTLVDPILLTGSAAITSNFNGQDISCNGLADGEATMTATGGTGTLTYTWTNGDNTPIADSLSAGTYYVAVTDVNGCSIIDSVTLVDPILLSGSAAITSNFNGQDISCNGLADGEATMSASGGTGTLTYAWTNGDNTPIADSLSAGTYYVTVTEVNGCSIIDSVTLVDPTLLSGSAAITSNFNGQDISCNGLADGEATMSASGGTGTLTYAWTNGDDTPIADSLSAGTYYVTVTDINGCNITDSVTLVDPTLLSGSAAITSDFNGEDISCNGLADGEATMTATGGTGTLTYTWTNGDDTPIADSLSAGTYYVTVIDVNGCSIIDSVTLDDPILLSGSAAITSDFNGEDISCNGLADGEATMTATGGTGTLAYAWTNGDDTPIADSLSAGTYYVTVTDVNACSIIDSVTLVDPTLLSGSAAITSDFNGEDISCNGLADGEATMTATGGTGTLTYAWTNGDDTPIADSLSAGTYYITVTDVNACSIIDSVTLIDPTLLSGGAAITSDFNGEDISCNGLADGEATMTATGGTGTLTYAWTNGDDTPIADSLSAGTYYVTVADVNGCSITDSVTLVDPALLSGSVRISSDYNGQDISCNGFADGEATMSATGGTGTLTYTWTNGDITAIADSLSAGTYYVTVIDVNGCSIIDSVTLTEPDGATFEFVTIEPLCYGNENGELTVRVTGGTIPISYLWSNGDTTSTITNIGADIYTVNVTDGNGCTYSETVTLNQPDELDGTIYSPVYPNGYNVSVYDGNDGSVEVDVFGGIEPYIYEWSNGDSSEVITDLPEGIYTVLVTDDNGCTLSLSQEVTEPDALKMPTGFSPNFDGYNDYFVIIGIDEFPDNEIVVFNRWGDEVYKTSNYQNNWYGENKNGEPLPDGTYFVVFKVNGGEITLTGYVDVRRE